MELEIIKTQTTWNDAAASLNNNFVKISRAVRDGIPVVNTPVDEEMSDTSTNAVQNKVVYSELQKKQGTISDLADIRSGAALGKTALQSVPSEYVTESELTEKGYATTSQVNDKQDRIDDLEAIRSGAAKGETAIQKVKTINGESIEGEGNIVIGGGEGGLKYVEERTVYANKMIIDGEVTDSRELSETEKAYNIETLDKAINERSVIIVAAGLIFQFVYAKSDSTERIGKFSSVGDIGNDLLSVSITINQDGDAIFEQKVLEFGEGGETDTSNLATKDELNNLTNEIIANEEVYAAAANDLLARASDNEERISSEIDARETLQEEFQMLKTSIIENEEVIAATLNDIEGRFGYWSDTYATKKEAKDGVQEVTNAMLENEEVIAAALANLNEQIATLRTQVESLISAE